MTKIYECINCGYTHHDKTTKPYHCHQCEIEICPECCSIDPELCIDCYEDDLD